MNKEDFIKAKEKLSKEDIIADYWKSEEELIKRIGIENKSYLLQQENQELKKQLEQYEEEVCILDMRTDENIKYKNQQKEFIEYLEDKIKGCIKYSKYIENKSKELHGRGCGRTYIANEIMKNEVAKKCFSEILLKYKEIIGWVKNER